MINTAGDELLVQPTSIGSYIDSKYFHGTLVRSLGGGVYPERLRLIWPVAPSMLS